MIGHMKLTPFHLDALTEIVNIGIGQAASILNEMLNSHVILQVPHLDVIERDDLPKYFTEYGEDNLSSVKMDFTGNLNGVSSLIFPPDSATKLVSILTGEKIGTSDLDSVRMETLNEVGNIVLNGVMGSIGNIMEKHIDFSIPVYSEGKIEDMINQQFNMAGTIVFAEGFFTVEKHKIRGNIVLLFEMFSMDALLDAIQSA